MRAMGCSRMLCSYVLTEQNESRHTFGVITCFAHILRFPQNPVLLLIRYSTTHTCARRIRASFLEIYLHSSVLTYVLSLTYRYRMPTLRPRESGASSPAAAVDTFRNRAGCGLTHVRVYPTKYAYLAVCM